jgi:hypothetical protein
MKHLTTTLTILVLAFVYSCSSEESKRLPYAPEWIESASWVDEVAALKRLNYSTKVI